MTGSKKIPSDIQALLIQSFEELVSWWDCDLSRDVNNKVPLSVSEIYGQETSDMVERARDVRAKLWMSDCES